MCTYCLLILSSVKLDYIHFSSSSYLFKKVLGMYTDNHYCIPSWLESGLIEHSWFFCFVIFLVLPHIFLLSPLSNQENGMRIHTIVMKMNFMNMWVSYYIESKLIISRKGMMLWGWTEWCEIKRKKRGTTISSQEKRPTWWKEKRVEHDFLEGTVTKAEGRNI